MHGGGSANTEMRGRKDMHPEGMQNEKNEGSNE